MAGSSPPELLVLAPIRPSPTGNGLAMRTAAFVEATRTDFNVSVVVVPVAGQTPGSDRPLGVTVSTVIMPDPVSSRRYLIEQLSTAGWGELLGAANPMPGMAMSAPPGLSAEVVKACSARPGTALHVMRSYLAPLGLAVAQRLGSPWATLDLDDDDEEMFRPDNPQAADAFKRLVSVFATRFSAVSLASPDGAEAIRARHGIETFTVVNSVRPAEGVSRPAGRGPLNAVFIGNLSYRPNIEAARILAEEVLPRLRSRGARVTIVGSHDPSGEIGRLATLPGVEVTGFVEDLAEVYARADVMVAPLQAGSGTRIKILEAFAAGVPVVTTTVGAAGIEVKNGEHLLIGNTPEAIADHVDALARSDALARRLSETAARLVAEGHSPAAVEAQVRSMLAFAASRPVRVPGPKGGSA